MERGYTRFTAQRVVRTRAWSIQSLVSPVFCDPWGPLRDRRDSQLHQKRQIAREGLVCSSSDTVLGKAVLAVLGGFCVFVRLGA